MKKTKGFYLLTNLLTTCGFASALMSIFFSIQGHYSQAAMAIFVSIIFDVFDGKIARATKTSSEFGMHYDSLSDLVSFGVAPTVLTYMLAGQTTAAILVAIFYSVCMNIRLARFNANIKKKSVNFIGLPSPAAAICIAATVLILLEYHLLTHALAIPIFLAFVCLLALLAISAFSYKSSKSAATSKKPHQFKKSISIDIVLIALVFWKPVLFMPFIGYAYLLYNVFFIFTKKGKIQKA